MPSFRADLLTRRTYCRPLEDGTYETWAAVCDRVMHHQRWLWERAQGHMVTEEQHSELTALFALMYDRIALPSGRILWMGGTAQAKKTEIAMFNCAFGAVRDIYSAVDAFYLLLNGCGVGFKPVAGLLNGFTKKAEIITIPGGTVERGDAHNEDYFYGIDRDSVWHLCIGDSGKAWAKAFGKLLSMKKPVDKIILDFREVRKAGQPIKGYGWMSSGDAQIRKAFEMICGILNSASDRLLTEIEILDIINLVGTTLSSRRSAEIAMLNADNPHADEFASAKNDHYAKGLYWRSQSNNTLVFYSRPSLLELRGLFARMLADGGSEPGLFNGANARRRAPWFSGSNPCGEILLPDGGLCNLVDIDLGKLVGMTSSEIRKVFKLIARANYRQTCVDLKDGVLSDRWHETNEFLRLCGVGLTGIIKWELASDLEKPVDYAQMRYFARDAADSMARELGLPLSKAVTTIKPSGTLGKIMDTTEGLHKPLGRYIFNRVKFHENDPLVVQLTAANYMVDPDPYGGPDVIVCLPVDNGDLAWDLVNGIEVNLEPAVVQLDRYKKLMDAYVDHNASVTISYDPSEVEAICKWLFENWDCYVGVSFILRADPFKTAEDLGYPYLPQEIVSKETYDRYTSQLLPVSIDGGDMLDTGECAGGACPIR